MPLTPTRAGLGAQQLTPRPLPSAVRHGSVITVVLPSHGFTSCGGPAHTGFDGGEDRQAGTIQLRDAVHGVSDRRPYRSPSPVAVSRVRRNETAFISLPARGAGIAVPSTHGAVKMVPGKQVQCRPASWCQCLSNAYQSNSRAQVVVSANGHDVSPSRQVVSQQ